MIFWHGFKEPVWFPYRNTFIFSFFICVLTGKAFQKLDLSVKSIVLSFIIIAFFIFRAFLIRNIWFTMTLLCIGVIFIVLHIVGIFSYSKLKFKCFGAVLLVGVCIIELTTNTVFNMRQFENYSQRYLSDFYMNTSELLDHISNNKNYDMRVEKTYYRTFNDPMMFGYPGITHFGSTEDTETANLLNILGFTEETYTQNSTAFADSFLGIGYLFSIDEHLPEHFSVVYQSEKGVTAVNKHSFPMVYPLYNENYSEIDINDNIYITQNNLYKALGGKGELFTIYENEFFINENNVAIPFEEGYYCYALCRNISENKTTNQYYCKTYINNNMVVFENLSADCIDNIEIWRLNIENLSDLSHRLKQFGGKTNITPHSFSSEIVCPENRTYIINLPASKFLKINVDGQEVETSSFRGITSVYLSKGSHTIQATGRVIGYRAGVTITVISILFLIAHILYQKNNK